MKTKQTKEELITTIKKQVEEISFLKKHLDEAIAERDIRKFSENDHLKDAIQYLNGQLKEHHSLSTALRRDLDSALEELSTHKESHQSAAVDIAVVKFLAKSVYETLDKP